MRTFPLVVLAMLAACATETPAPTIQVDVYVPDQEPPTIIVEVPAAEVPADTENSEELACELIEIRTDIGNGWEWISVSDDLVATTPIRSIWVPATTSLGIPIMLETLLGCAPVHITGITWSLTIIGDESQARAVETFEQLDSLVMTRVIGGTPRLIAQNYGTELYYRVEDISSWVGTDTWQGFASGALTENHNEATYPFQAFDVEPAAQEELEVTFNGLDKLPLGLTMEVSIGVWYAVDGVRGDPKLFMIPVLITN